MCGREDLRRLITALPNTLVVLDEAYMDFSDQSMLPEVERFDNLIILRTCSKAFGMAALRLGFAVCQKPLADALRAVKSPYNVNSPVPGGRAPPCCATGRSSRPPARPSWPPAGSCAPAWSARPGSTPGRFTLLPGETNFAALSMPDGEALLRFLGERGVAIRYTGGLVRITCGTPEENRILLTELEAYWNRERT